jgi:ferric hydroxamate transport system substrate-binding protein
MALPTTGPGALSRRAFLALGAAGLVVRPAFAADMRVACVEWTAAATLLSLGLAPVAAGDVPDYPTWVVEPTMPRSVIDLGSRFQPNLELLVEIAPDLVVVTEGYGVDAGTFAGLAPVHTLKTIPVEGESALANASAEARRLAERIGRPDAAARLEADTEAALAAARARLAPLAGEPVCVASLFEERSIRIYASGLVDEVLARLGLANAWAGETGGWGFSYVGIERLATLPAGTRLVLLDPLPDPVRLRLEASSLWANLPVVRGNRVLRAPPVWPFGGLDAAQRLARILSRSLVAA